MMAKRQHQGSPNVQITYVIVLLVRCKWEAMRGLSRLSLRHISGSLSLVEWLVLLLNRKLHRVNWSISLRAWPTFPTTSILYTVGSFPKVKVRHKSHNIDPCNQPCIYLHRRLQPPKPKHPQAYSDLKPHWSYTSPHLPRFQNNYFQWPML